MKWNRQHLYNLCNRFIEGNFQHTWLKYKNDYGNEFPNVKEASIGIKAKDIGLVDCKTKDDVEEVKKKIDEGLFDDKRGHHMVEYDKIGSNHTQLSKLINNHQIENQEKEENTNIIERKNIISCNTIYTPSTVGTKENNLGGLTVGTHFIEEESQYLLVWIKEPGTKLTIKKGLDDNTIIVDVITAPIPDEILDQVIEEMETTPKAKEIDTFKIFTESITNSTTFSFLEEINFETSKLCDKPNIFIFKAKKKKEKQFQSSEVSFVLPYKKKLTVERIKISTPQYENMDNENEIKIKKEKPE
jgi:hypothetical protein